MSDEAAPFLAKCFRCGTEFGHPGPCPRCVPLNGANIMRALNLANTAHFMQFRKGFRKGDGKYVPDQGEPFLSHPLSLCKLMVRAGFNPNEHIHVFEVALLHDSVEDKGITFEDIRRTMGSVVESYVRELTFIPTDPDDKEKFKQEKILYKSEDTWMKSSVISLIVKNFDQFNNASDFGWTNFKYGATYFGGAKGIFSALNKRSKEVAEKYGKEILGNVLSMHDYLNDRFASSEENPLLFSL